MFDTKERCVRRSCSFFALVAAASVLASPAASAAPDPTPDPTASVVFMRTSCDVAGTPKENCFESMASLFDLSTGWVWNVRIPTAAAPLLVSIGPGTFDDAPFECNAGGYVSLRGSGRDQTRIAPAAHAEAVVVTDCSGLEFSNLTIRAMVPDPDPAVRTSGVHWRGSGSSNWINTDIIGDLSGSPGESVVYAWWEDTPDCGETFESVHYFYDSRLRAVEGGTYTTTLLALCSQNWFYGSEIVGESQRSGLAQFTVAITGHGDVRAFGTPIRLSSQSSNAFAVIALGDSVFHMHGGNIAPSGPNRVVAVRADENAFVHTPGSAMRPTTTSPTGTVQRLETLSGTPQIESPFVWRQGTTPPLSKPGDPSSAPVGSITGADMFVETDCDAGGCSGGADPHLMIYASNCTGAGGPWFDVARNACRQ